MAADPILYAQIDASAFTEENIQQNSPHTRGVRNLHSLITATKVQHIYDVTKHREFQVPNSSSNVEIVANPNKLTVIIQLQRINMENTSNELIMMKPHIIQ